MGMAVQVPSFRLRGISLDSMGRGRLAILKDVVRITSKRVPLKEPLTICRLS